MNKIYSLLLASFFSIAAFAAERPKSARLTIATYDNVSIRVEIDGRSFNDNDNAIRINNINAGYHNIQVYRRSGNSREVFGRNREKLLYSTSMYVKPEHQVDILIDRSGRARVNEYDLGRKGRDNRRDDDWNRRNENGRWDDYGSWDDNRNDGKWNDRDNRDNDNWDKNDRSDYGRAVSYESFQSMKQTLRRESFDNSRLTLAKQMMERNNFETSQVKEMLYLFSFESNRLELAKYAYRNTVDKKNYFSLYDAFSFSSSKEELSKYIGSYR
ncbi:MAG: DUF4476 domain-containing protein [Chitinophagaceae bacterium]